MPKRLKYSKEKKCLTEKEFSEHSVNMIRWWGLSSRCCVDMIMNIPVILHSKLITSMIRNTNTAPTTFYQHVWIFLICCVTVTWVWWAGEESGEWEINCLQMQSMMQMILTMVTLVMMLMWNILFSSVVDNLLCQT